jgi:prepilin-type N-terminal cleavage/methylation domain-containing protein
MSNPFGQRENESACAQNGRCGLGAFTIIELLVVISIIGVLASLVVGVSGLATRKSKESRLRTELTKLVNDIENYKSTMGFYPPDNELGQPSTNQLYYELSGVVFRNNTFYLPGGMEPVRPGAFGATGFANAQREENKGELKFRTTFKGSQVKTINTGAHGLVDVLVSPVKGRPFNAPQSWTMKSVNGEDVNPWLYVSKNPTNNPDRFDLWTEVLVGGKLMRFSNWDRDPVVLSP